MNKGVISMGVTCPIIREGDDLVKIVVDSVLKKTEVREGKGIYYDINNNDIIGITESIVARAQGNYVSVDEIAEDIKSKFGENSIITVIKPIYSRNRFSMILKGIARAASKIIFVMPPFDEVGNPSGVNPYTGVDIKEYYKEICENENCESDFINWEVNILYSTNWLYCGLHDFKTWSEVHNPLYSNSTYKFYTLADICSDKCEYGLLGSNKATEETLKLFPNGVSAKALCDQIKAEIKQKTDIDVIVMIYGDGCYKDADQGIWEFADPVCSPAYTNEDLLNSTPNEVKVKALADNEFKNLSGEELNSAINEKIKSVKNQSLVGKMVSQGTTPRRYVNLLASLMDLTSGSGDRCTPIILVKNYFRK